MLHVEQAPDPVTFPLPPAYAPMIAPAAVVLTTAPASTLSVPGGIRRR
jgi:hypothetical protein